MLCCQIDGVTPLCIASVHGRTEVVTALLAAGARIEAATVCAVHVGMLLRKHHIRACVYIA